MSIAVVTFALLAQVLPPPASVRWEMVVGQGQEGLEVDPATIVREGDVVGYTIRLHVTEQDDSPLRVMILRHVLNCRTRQHGIAAGDGYGANGRLITSRESAPDEISYAPFSTAEGADLVYRRVCGTGAR